MVSTVIKVCRPLGDLDKETYHLIREERKCSRERRSQEGVCSHCTSSIRSVRIDLVRKAGRKGQAESYAKEDGGDLKGCGHDMDIRLFNVCGAQRRHSRPKPPNGH